VPGAEGQQALEFLAGGYAVGPQIEMQPVLDGLALRHGDDIDRRPATVVRSNADDVRILVDYTPAKDGAPEIGHHPRLDRVDGNDS
jgi:hypothetical protein